jgi:dienelactone hydrolase
MLNDAGSSASRSTCPRTVTTSARNPASRAGVRDFERGENFVLPFTARMKTTLDYLVRERYSDPRRIAIIGISRGGFMALHTMAADPRVTVVAALASGH